MVIYLLDICYSRTDLYGLCWVVLKIHLSGSKIQIGWKLFRKEKSKAYIIPIHMIQIGVFLLTTMSFSSELYFDDNTTFFASTSFIRILNYWTILSAIMKRKKNLLWKMQLLLSGTVTNCPRKRQLNQSQLSHRLPAFTLSSHRLMMTSTFVFIGFWNNSNWDLVFRRSAGNCFIVRRSHRSVSLRSAF